MSFWDTVDLTETVDPVAAARALADLIGAASVTRPDTPDQQATQAISQPYEGDAPITGAFREEREGHTHAGIDFGVPAGTSILSMAAGTVVEVVSDGQGGGYGNYVIVDHGNGLTTRYAHLTNATVAVGDKVTAGGQLGISGSTGHSTGAHLHFEVMTNGTPVDPSPYLAGGGAIIGNPQGEPYSPEEVVAMTGIEAFTEDPKSPFDVQDTPKTTTATPATSKTTGQGDFFAQVLAGIGAPDTPENRRALQAWAQAEGMDPAHNNPFATTQGAPGASVLNDHGVKHYGDMATGVQATIQTLLNGRYANIIAALKAGTDALAVANAIEASPWGTGGLVREVLGG